MPEILDYTSIGIDGKLNTQNSLINQRVLETSIMPENISSGVFGAISRTAGIEFGEDNANSLSYLQSRNFATGSTGWRNDSSGAIEAQSGTFRGVIQASSGYFGGTTDGVQISSTGLYIVGNGLIQSSASPNSRFQLENTAGASSYDSSNRRRIDISGKYIQFYNVDGSQSGGIYSSDASDLDMTFAVGRDALFTGKSAKFGQLTTVGAGYLHIMGDDDSDNHPGQLVLYDHAGNDYFVWIDRNGVPRIHTATPTDEDADGSMIATRPAYTASTYLRANSSGTALEFSNAGLGIQNIATGVGIDPGTNATQDITIGFTPKIILFFTSMNDTGSQGPYSSSGSATGTGVGTNRCVAFNYEKDVDGNYAVTSETYCMYVASQITAKTYAYVSTFGSTTTLTWVCDANYTIIYHWIALA